MKEPSFRWQTDLQSDTIGGTSVATMTQASGYRGRFMSILRRFRRSPGLWTGRLSEHSVKSNRHHSPCPPPSASGGGERAAGEGCCDAWLLGCGLLGGDGS